MRSDANRLHYRVHHHFYALPERKPARGHGSTKRARGDSGMQPHKRSVATVQPFDFVRATTLGSEQGEEGSGGGHGLTATSRMKKVKKSKHNPAPPLHFRREVTVVRVGLVREEVKNTLYSKEKTSGAGQLRQRRQQQGIGCTVVNSKNQTHRKVIRIESPQILTLATLPLEAYTQQKKGKQDITGTSQENLPRSEQGQRERQRLKD